MALAYFVDRPLRFLVSAGIGTFLAYRFPAGPIPYIDPLFKRFEPDKSSMAKTKKAEIEMARIYHIIREKGGAANSMTLGELAEDLKLDEINDIIRKKGKAAKSMTAGELAEEIRYFGGIWEELAKSKDNQGANQKKKD